MASKGPRVLMVLLVGCAALLLVELNAEFMSESALSALTPHHQTKRHCMCGGNNGGNGYGNNGGNGYGNNGGNGYSYSYSWGNGGGGCCSCGQCGSNNMNSGGCYGCSSGGSNGCYCGKKK
uniref:Glycine-rich protein-like n=1 Tax=Globodera pallida TaxID=36090 RepID=A0A183BRF9_GLOPA